jgi:hypothetical protein
MPCDCAAVTVAGLCDEGFMSRSRGGDCNVIRQQVFRNRYTITIWVYDEKVNELPVGSGALDQIVLSDGPGSDS